MRRAAGPCSSRTDFRTPIGVAIVLFVGAGRVSGEGATFAPGQIRSVAERVYAAPQAERGRQQYAHSCVSCHEEDLSGFGEAPALAGREFLATWQGKTLLQLFEKTRTTMPDGSPGSLGDAVYVDLLAYVLQQNKFPEGTDELRLEALNRIAFTNR